MTTMTGRLTGREMDMRGDPWLKELAGIRHEFETRMAQLLPDSANGADALAAAMRAGTLGAGKRMRPLLLMLVARDLGCASPALFDIACAVEMVHAASLILDDMPCMDNAMLRRGQPTIHVQYGEDVAVLASVALLSRAFGVLATAPGIPAGGARAPGGEAGRDGRHARPGARPVRRPARQRPALGTGNRHHQRVEDRRAARASRSTWPPSWPRPTTAWPNRCAPLRSPPATPSRSATTSRTTSPTTAP